MSRSGYTEDGWCEGPEEQWAAIRYQGAVKSAIRGKRGQAFFKELAAALDAMPVKRLIAHELVEEDGNVCALGAVAQCRGLDVSTVDETDPEQVGAAFGIAEALAREIVYMNDEYFESKTPEERWAQVRAWVSSKIIVRQGLTISQRHILEHALGAKSKKPGYRNRFIAPEGSAHFADCEALVKMEYLEKHTDPTFYRVTMDGQYLIGCKETP